MPHKDPAARHAYTLEWHERKRLARWAKLSPEMRSLRETQHARMLATRERRQDMSTEQRRSDEQAGWRAKAAQEYAPLKELNRIERDRLRAERDVLKAREREARRRCKKCGGQRESARGWYCLSCYRAIGSERERKKTEASACKAVIPKKVSAEALRQSQLRQYGLSEEEFQDRLKTQGYGCAICGEKRYTARTSRLGVDHDHDTGKIRGLLCSPCNMGLGAFRDDVGRLQQAIYYLEASREH